jgi:hypothetical protein
MFLHTLVPLGTAIPMAELGRHLHGNALKVQVTRSEYIMQFGNLHAHSGCCRLPFFSMGDCANNGVSGTDTLSDARRERCRDDDTGRCGEEEGG